jgi:tetratricopeptide (TPR) repeat protein
MFYFLGEGEKYLRDGNYAEALTQFLEARQSNPNAVLPFVRIGDMFVRQNNLGDARLNYRTAALRAPNNIEIWSKYINVLIQSYEWEDATAAMERFRKLPVPQSAIDKAAADLYDKQGRPEEAQRLYRKAMGRETIDSGVYIAYAKSLMETHHYKEAPFFFALAMRFDPLNTEALIGTAKCVAETEGIDRAISMLQDELSKGSFARAELLAAIADLNTQKGSWDLAQQYVDQSTAADPEYAYPWKVQAAIYMNSASEKGMLDKALAAYQSYCERNPSDPIGHLERYRIFIRKGDSEKAFDELDRIFAIYPKYPNLHFYKGALFAMIGNHKAAVDELQTELKNNPDGVSALILLGKEMIQNGAATESLGYFNKAMKIAPRNPEAKAESAFANYLLKNFAGAIALYQAALSLDPANPTLYKRLGMAYQAQGDEGNAAAAFHKYLEMEPDAPDKSEFERYR